MAGFVSFARRVLPQPGSARRQVLTGNPTGATATVAMVGVGTLTVTATTGSVDVYSDTYLDKYGALLQSAAVAFTGAGVMAVGSAVSHVPAVAMTGAGTLTVTATGGTVTAAVSLVGAGALAVGPSVTHVPAVAMSGAGALTVTPTLTTAASVGFTGAGSLTATPLVTHPVAVAMNGAGALTVIPTGGSQFGSVTLVGVGALTVTSLVTRVSVVAMGGFGTLTIVGGGMTALPAAVTFGTVKAWLGAGVNQAPDPDGYPDLVALAGTITFTSVKTIAVYSTASPAPLILAPKQVVASLDSNGYLVGTKTGEQLVRLIVGQWLVRFDLVGVTLPTFNLTVSAGVTTDLADVIPVS